VSDPVTAADAAAASHVDSELPAQALADTATPAGRTQARNRRGIATERRLIAAALEVFGTSGYTNTRVTDVAEACALSQGGFYRYFDSKSDLFSALIRQLEVDIIADSRSENVDFRSDPSAAIRHANRGYFKAYEKYAGTYRAFREAALVDKLYEEAHVRIRRRFRERFLHALETGGYDRVKFEPTVVALQACTEEMAYITLAQRMEVNAATVLPPEDIADVVTNIWLAALAPLGLKATST
jgi:AcrR family transcriptional regulator